MNIGTKSILFGVHQFVLHPLQVFLAWVVLYKSLPKFHQLCAIVTHDWGYWGSPNMDGIAGSEHPRRAGDAWRNFGKFGRKVSWEIYGHSGSYASEYNIPRSKLFKADKLCVIFIPCYLYVVLSSLSGEIREYMEISYNKKLPNITTKDKIKWFFMTTGRIMERVYE